MNDTSILVLKNYMCHMPLAYAVQANANVVQ